MPSLPLGTQPADVPYATTVVRCEYQETLIQQLLVVQVFTLRGSEQNCFATDLV